MYERTTLEIMLAFKRIEREVKSMERCKQFQEDMSLKYEMETILRNLDVFIEQLQRKVGKP